MQLVSIICTCFNHEKHVIATLESVWSQSHNNIEIIIIDDASTDNSVALIDDWIKNKPTIQFLKNSFNLGITKSFNKAAKLATGEFLFDLATDDILYPDAIEKLVNKFNISSYKKLGLVYANLENINEEGAHISNYFKKSESDRPTGTIFKNIIDTGKTICSPTALIAKKAFDFLNGYDENLAYEDLDFWIRLARKFEIDYVDAILVKKRIIENSLGKQFYCSKNSKKMNHSTYLILQKTIKICENKEELKTVMKRIHHEIILNYHTRNFILLLQLLILKVKCSITSLKRIEYGKLL